VTTAHPPNSPDRTDAPILVVGAGIIGLCSALHLRQATRRRIVVVEAGPIGAGTTPAGAGFVAPWATVLPHLGAEGLALAEYALGYYRDIAASGVDIRYRTNGNIVLFNHQATFDSSVPAIMNGPHRSPDTRVLTPDEVVDLTSGAVDGSRVAGGVLMPRGIQLETGLLLDHLAVLATEAGIELRPHTRVTAVDVAGGRVHGVELAASDGNRNAPASQTLDSDCVVLAAGAWLNSLLGPVGWTLPLLPFVATRFVTADLGIAPTMPTIQAKDFPMWIRESDGGLTWGSTPGCAPAHRLDAGWATFDPEQRLYPHLVDAMLADAAGVAEVFPSLAGAEIVLAIQGMPVYTVDRQFFVGSVPGCAGLWAAGGDNESGVSHAPGIGRLVADLVTGSDSPICDPHSYRLDRFDPSRYPDAEAVGQQFAKTGEGFIADAMHAGAPTR
jgi:glycine/D-amino acid oxidase-like deaminating enzyme